MAEQTTVDTESRERIGRLVFGGMATQVIGAAARLGVADAIGEGTRDATGLAAELGTEEQATLRLARALAALGVLTETESGTFALTRLGGMLRSDGPGSMHGFVRMFTDPTMLQAWFRLDDAVRTGTRKFDDEFGTDFFGYLKDRPELSEQFNGSMRQGSLAVAAALPGMYDFSAAGTVVDIGGGDGTVLAPVLAANPAARGILFDTAEGLAECAPVLAAAGVQQRCDTSTGDFFTAVPQGDTYLIKSVLHDWNDERCTTILRAIRARIPEHGRLLVLEPVLAPSVRPDAMPGPYLSDLNMLVLLDGRERTEAEFTELLRAGGFTVNEVRPFPAAPPFSLLEATPTPG